MNKKTIQMLLCAGLMLVAVAAGAQQTSATPAKPVEASLPAKPADAAAHAPPAAIPLPEAAAQAEVTAATLRDIEASP